MMAHVPVVMTRAPHKGLVQYWGCAYLTLGKTRLLVVVKDCLVFAAGLLQHCGNPSVQDHGGAV